MQHDAVDTRRGKSRVRGISLQNLHLVRSAICTTAQLPDHHGRLLDRDDPNPGGKQQQVESRAGSGEENALTRTGIGESNRNPAPPTEKADERIVDPGP